MSLFDHHYPITSSKNKVVNVSFCTNKSQIFDPAWWLCQKYARHLNQSSLFVKLNSIFEPAPTKSSSFSHPDPDPLLPVAPR
jgi:hypothetical protein